MNIQELYTLLKKYRERRCTIEESDKLNCWFEQFQEEADRIPGIPEEKLERLFSQIESKILFSQSVRQMQKRLFRRLAGLAAMIASVWFSLAQGVKRLHDLNKSGWLILLCCVPIVGWIFALYMLFADGTVGPNPYGADPKNRMPYQAQPASVNVTVNVSREDVKVDKPVEAAPAPAEAPVEEDKEKAE